MTLNSGLQIAAYCVLIVLSLLPRLRMMRDRRRELVRGRTDHSPLRRTVP